MTNTKNTKRALLSSVLALFLCFTMLLGTTYAWFTDSVTSANNIIKSGTLNVEMYYADGSKTVPADNSTDWKNAQGVAIYTANQLWEPGYTDAKHIKISNEGTLALKYQLAIIPTGTVSELAEVIDVYLYEIANTDANATQVATRDEVDPTMYVGTLADVISKGIVQGTLTADTDYTTTIVLKMRENAGNEYQDKSIGDDFTIQLLATQLNSEKDSFDADYDKDAWMDGMQVYTASDLQAAINAGETNIKLMDDITLDEPIVIPASATTFSMRSATPATVIDLNGKTITGTEGRDADNNRIHVIVNNGILTIKDGTVKSAGNDGGSAIYNNAGATLTIENVTLYGAPQSDPVYEAGVSKPFPSYAVNNYGNAVVNGATIKSYHGAIATGGNGVTVINDADIDVGLGQSTGITSYAIYSYENAQVTVNGGKFAFTKQEIYVNGGNTFCELGTNPIIINGGNYTGTSFSTGEGREYVIKGGTFDADPSAYVADGFKAVENNGVYYVVSDSIDNVVTSVEQLQKALDEATGDAMIVIAADINGDVIVNQKEGVNITIDGANYDYDGVISIYGHARHTGVETLTIKNIDFVTNSDVELRYYIDSNWTDEARRYAHNVTIDNCTFTNNGTGTVVPARFRQAYDITMKNCTVDGTFSPIWATGGIGLTIDNVTANCTDEGIHVGTTDDVVIKNCNVTVAGANGYGVRADATGAYTMTITTCTFDAANVIVLRNAVAGYTATIDGKIVVYNQASLQAALDNAIDGAVLYFANDIVGNVTVTQKPDVKITIDGNGYTYNGVITVDGKSARYETAALTILNVNFAAETLSADAFIRLGYVDAARYTNNVTVKDCTFTGKGFVAVKSYTGGDWDVTLDNLTVNAGMHSLAQLKNVEKNLVVTGCKVYSKNGLNVNNGTNLTMDGCIFDVQGYAVRFGESANTTDETFNISNSTLKSACAEDGDAVIEFRKGAVNATLNLTNTKLDGKVTFEGATADTKVHIDDEQLKMVFSDDELKTAIANGATEILLAPGEFIVDLYNISYRDSLTITGHGADTKLAFSNLQVRASQFDKLTISNCTIERMPNKSWGHLVFGSSTTAGGEYTISNCIFNGVGSQGIYINQNVAATFNIENCTFNGDFGGEGAITIQNNDGVDVTVNVTDCEFNNIPATSHEIYILYAYNGWTLNADGVTAYWKANQ